MPREMPREPGASAQPAPGSAREREPRSARDSAREREPRSARDSGRAREPRSALDSALERVGDRWTLLLVEALLDEPRRFGDLLERVPGIAPNILTRRLRELERSALVVARPYSTRPPRFVYELSAGGRELAGALRLLADWGARQSESAEPVRHYSCGSALEARWYCPVCEVTVDDPDVEDVRIV